MTDASQSRHETRRYTSTGTRTMADTSQIADTEAPPTSVTLNDDQMALVAQFLMVKDERKHLEKDEKELRDTLLQQLEEAGAKIGLNKAGTAVIEIQIQHRRVVNRARLEALHPEVFEDVVDEVEVKLVQLNSWQ